MGKIENSLPSVTFALQFRMFGWFIEVVQVEKRKKVCCTGREAFSDYFSVYQSSVSVV